MSERQQGRCLAKAKEFCDKSLENGVKSVWNDMEDGLPHDYVVNTLSLCSSIVYPIPTVDHGIHIIYSDSRLSVHEKALTQQVRTTNHGFPT